jgi:menaquinone-9 beta-reductase
MPTQPPRRPPRPADLFGFKAHFAGSALRSGVMPLLAFPGGYGGMVHTDAGRVSLSCCIRRDMLARCRRNLPDGEAGDAVLAHIESSCTGARLALRPATREGRWLSAGPLRTGIRTFGSGGLLAVGNAAAEAHPVIAEGISIGIQSAALLCEQLASRLQPGISRPVVNAQLDLARAAYAAAWRRNFARRLHVAAFFAHVFMRPVPTRLAVALVRSFPQLLTCGARCSGKTATLQMAGPDTWQS